MKVSIVILTWLIKPDLIDYTKRCIHSIRERCRGENYEIIVVDNGSPVEYHETLKELSDKIIFNKENKGFSTGCNQGAEIAEGEFLLFINNDTVIYEDIVTILVNSWRDGIGALGASMRKNFRVNDWEYLEGWCLFTSREVWNLVGGFDDVLFSPAYGEDADWCYRVVQEHKLTIQKIKLNIFHHSNKTSEGTDIRNKFFYYNLKKLIEKWKPTNNKIGVVIPCHNYGKYLDECIQSVLKQTLPVHRIIVVDDASDENIKKIVKKYKSVEYYRVDFRMANKTRNFGLKKLDDCNYFLLLDADNYISEIYMDRMLDYMNINQAAGYAYCDRYIINKESEVTGEEKFREFDFNELKKRNFIDFASLMKREVYDFSGGLDESPEFNTMEDWDFWINVGFKGFIGHYIPEKLVYYRRHELSKTTYLKNNPEAFTKIKNIILKKYNIIYEG